MVAAVANFTLLAARAVNLSSSLSALIYTVLILCTGTIIGFADRKLNVVSPTPLIMPLAAVPASRNSGLRPGL